MIAYKKEALDNMMLQQQLEEVFIQQCISATELNACKEKYPVNLYTPNIFVRIGLFILTAIIAFFSFGLFLLSAMGENGITVMLVVCGLLSYGALEFMVQSNKHYKSGVDDALMWMSGIFIVAAFNIKPMPWLGNSALVFVITGFLAVRFVNQVISAFAAIAFFAVVFFAYIQLGQFAKATVPFVTMGVSLIAYFLSAKQMHSTKYYGACLQAIQLVSLAFFYCSGNYFIIRELSNTMFNLNLQDGQTIPFAWLFWIFTAIIPFVYLAKGIQKKDILLIRMGLLAIAAIVFTVRYYYHVLPMETAMITGGIIMIGTAYLLIKYLKESKHGFCDEEQKSNNPFAKKQLEALLIAQTFTGAKTEISTAKFGGGSSGGGGATGEF